MRAFSSLIALSLAAYSSALSVSTPASASAGDPVIIAWQSTATSDPPSFTLFLLDANDLPFGLKQDFGSVTTAAGHATFTLDNNLPNDITYIIRAVKNNNVDIVLAESAEFTLD
ncbi:hypothetical protein L218DRAFT_995159 [Marasmius fiardii PR-910]|nr:hypothetical protein L218DRAFT_995159 [Marasmius fiardii PR-910]